MRTSVRMIHALGLCGTALLLWPQTGAAEEVFAQAAPSSREELFGVKPNAPAKEGPATRDELFGVTPPSAAPGATREPLVGSETPVAADGRAIRWSGFFQEHLAYTYSEPGHWSRAVSRLQVNGMGQLSPALKYKISARLEADPVYFHGDFYPDRVQDDQGLDFSLEENYLDLALDDWDFRFGRQHIVWGEVVGLFFADVVSARDMRDFILPSFDILRIPQWAARAEYFGDNFHAEFVWIPVQTFDDIGKPGAEFYPSGLIGAPGARFNSVDEPSSSLSNSAYGMRVNTLLRGWDLAAFYYRSHSVSPTFHREIGPGPSVTFTPRPDRIWQTGATLSKDFGSVVLRGEAVYTHGQRYSVTDLADADGVVERNGLDAILGFDFTLQDDWRLNMQVFHREIYGDDDDIVPATSGSGVSALISTKLTPSVEPQLLWIQGLWQGGDRLVRPRVNWYFAKNSTLSVGADVFAGPRDGFFGRFRNRDRLYAELRYDF